MKISEFKTRAPFNELFPINPITLEAIKEDMKKHGYDKGMPIIIWERGDVVIDGHTRLEAARQVGITDNIPVWFRNFGSEAKALEYAIHNQRHRLNLTEAEILRCIEVVDKRRKRGGDRRSEEAKSKPPIGRIENRKSLSAQDTARVVGVSTRKVERARAVLADPEAAEEVRAGKKKISRAYKEIQANRKSQNQPEPAKNQGGDRRVILQKALAEIRPWREKYKDYIEFSAIFTAIDGCHLNLEGMEILPKADKAPHASEPQGPCPPVYVEEEGEEPQIPSALNDELPRHHTAVDSADQPSPSSDGVDGSEPGG